QACLPGLPLEALLLVELLAQAAGGRVAGVGEGGEPAGGGEGLPLLVEGAPSAALAGFPAGAGFGDGPFAQLDLEVVEPFEVRGGHEHLSAHLDQRGVAAAAEALRDAVDLQRVDGDVLAGAAVAAGGRGDQLAVLVAEVDRQAVDLQLGEVA